jgi:hypothetical protein
MTFSGPRPLAQADDNAARVLVGVGWDIRYQIKVGLLSVAVFADKFSDTAQNWWAWHAAEKSYAERKIAGKSCLKRDLKLVFGAAAAVMMGKVDPQRRTPKRPVLVATRLVSEDLSAD